MFKIHTSLRFLTLTMALASGCADGANPDSSAAAPDNTEAPAELSLDSLPLVAQVTFPNQGTLSFYEPELGELLEIETGPSEPPRTRLADEDHLTSAQKYEALSGRPAPARLVELAAEEELELGSADVDVDAEDKAVNSYGEDNNGRDSFRERNCRRTDRYTERFDWSLPSNIGDQGINYYKFGIYAVNGPLPYSWFFNGNRFKHVLQAGWTISATIKHTGGGRYTDSQALPVLGSGILFDHCVNYHY